MLVELDDAENGRTFVPGLTIKFSDTPGHIGPIPHPGEHNEEIYCTLLGHSREELEAWHAEGII